MNESRMHTLRSFAASLLVLAGSAASARAGNVLIVDSSGSGQYTDIQSAVDAAQEGDVVLVRTGTYFTFLVSNKELAVVGDAGANVQIVGAIRVHDLAATK